MSEVRTDFTGVVLPVLYVKDTFTSVMFYRDVCGFSVASFYDEDSGEEVLEWTRSDPPRFVRMRAASQELALHLVRSDADIVGSAKHYFEVRDIERQRGRIQGQGGLPSDLVDLPWMTLFSVIDPDGHMLYFQEPNPEWKTFLRPATSHPNGDRGETPACSAQILLSDRLLAKWLAEFEPAAMRRCPSGLPNCPLWHAGHIAGNRRAMARQVGCILDEPEWLRSFEPGTSGTASEAWPDAGVVLTDLAETAERLSEHFASYSSRLDETTKDILSEGAATVRQNLLFLFYHEAFHSGQIRQARAFAPAEE